ncbi:MAG: plasmid mobilization relaxosome protein MobC, partial [Pseudomonadota bacterium]
EQRQRLGRGALVFHDHFGASRAALGRLIEQSRIASKLNQLAHHANMGLLFVGDVEREQIAEANAHLAEIRALLVTALATSR